MTSEAFGYWVAFVGVVTALGYWLFGARVYEEHEHRKHWLHGHHFQDHPEADVRGGI